MVPEYEHKTAYLSKILVREGACVEIASYIILLGACPEMEFYYENFKIRRT